MDYQPVPNLLLEALAYWGRRAGGYHGQYIAGRLQKRGVEDLSPFWAEYEPVQRLAEKLSLRAEIAPQPAARLFVNLPGFPYSPIGAYSIAFMLFYPVINQYRGDLRELLAYLRALPPEHTAQHLMLSLDLHDVSHSAASGPVDCFMEGVQSLDIPADSKLSLAECLHRYPTFLEEAGACLAPVLAELEARQDTLEDVFRSFSADVEHAGAEGYLRQISSLSPPPGQAYRLRPFLFGLDTNLTAEPVYEQGQGIVLVYGGVLRRRIMDLLARTEDAATAAHDAIKLLGDRTRFDILCFLRDRSAYGQELSDRFGLARNTIHHHMSKLVSAGLVSCTVEGNRVYYAVDAASVDRLLIQLRQLLLRDGRSSGNLT